MNRLIAAICFMALTLFLVSLPITSAQADEIKMVGAIVRIDIGGKEATMATVILKDNDTGSEVPIVVNDELTLDKFKDHRIVVDDEIRCKYEVKDGRNVSRYFRKTAGC